MADEIVEKRGRGRPPLTEAEKKKREKRAQKAKEEAAAKMDELREKHATELARITAAH